MNKLKYLVFSIFCFCFIPMIAAACSDSEKVRLGTLASNIKLNYDVTRETYQDCGKFVWGDDCGDATKYEFFGEIYNLADELYIVVKNSVNSSSSTLRPSDARDGVIRFKDLDENKIINYTLNVYASGGECANNVITTLNLTIPKVNSLITYDVCEEAPEHNLCGEFTDIDADINDSYYTVKQYIERRENAGGEEQTPPEEKTIIEEIMNFVSEKRYFLIGVGVIVIGAIITIVVIRKRRKK